MYFLGDASGRKKGTPCQELFLLVGISRMGLASVDVPLGQIRQVRMSVGFVFLLFNSSSATNALEGMVADHLNEIYVFVWLER